jgi:selenocysteine lyase/cysteine desulfurase
MSALGRFITAHRWLVALAWLAVLAAALAGAGHVGGRPSQIVVLRTDGAERLAGRLNQRGIRATSLGDRIRFGFHYFNDDHDVDRTVEALARAVRP